jgi:hypothetical protein
VIARRAYGHRLLRNSNPVPAAHTSPHPQSPISGLVAYTTQPRQLYPRPKALPLAFWNTLGSTFGTAGHFRGPSRERSRRHS